MSVLQDQHLLEASDLLWRCCAAAYVHVMDQHLSSAVDLLSTYKPSARGSQKERHQRPCSPTGKDSSHARVDLGRGRAFPDGHHRSGVMGFVCSSLDTVTWHRLCSQPDLVLVPVAVGAVCTPGQEEHAAVRIRLSLPWDFLRGAQDLSASPRRGLTVQNDPGTQRRAGEAEHQPWYRNAGNGSKAEYNHLNRNLVKTPELIFLL